MPRSVLNAPPIVPASGSVILEPGNIMVNENGRVKRVRHHRLTCMRIGEKMRLAICMLWANARSMVKPVAFSENARKLLQQRLRFGRSAFDPN